MRLEVRFPYHGSRAITRSPSPRPWRPDFRGTTGDSLSSPSYLVRNPNQALHIEKTHEMPPSSRDEGLLFLHRLESNPESSLQFLLEPRSSSRVVIMIFFFEDAFRNHLDRFYHLLFLHILATGYTKLPVCHQILCFCLRLGVGKSDPRVKSSHTHWFIHCL